MKRLVHNREKCLECAGCVGVCPAMALDMYNLDLQIDHEKCTKCGTCTRACPVGALTLEEVADAS
ncbi:MAG: 4Fe-4S binding protein [Fibrobacter sp.]|uniref:4Fe-4S binding protein n=1 Tax=Fibrobacter sp. TaxID=35828 RepID=UPI001566E8E5|nr:4Fe-4S binding protein [Fibrobacter sp.]MBR2898659.1 4Fe-4S binding protein [Fibrobacter sp.]